MTAAVITWPEVVLYLGLAWAFVAFIWVLAHSKFSLLDIEFRDPAERKPAEWKYERTERKTDEWEADK